MRNGDFIWNLMARAIYGEATESEKKELQQYLAQHQDLQQQYTLLYEVLKKGKEQHQPEDYTTQAKALLARAAGGSEAIHPGRAKLIRRRFVYYGAAAAVIAGICLYWGISRTPQAGLRPAYRIALEAPRGSRKQLVLPDGSSVWLNGGSRLFYVTDFKGRTREVKLEGEAFFDVVKKAEQPFIVHAGNMDIKVLGTAFNVKAYTDETLTTTALYRGLISVTKHGGKKDFQPVLLYPNQKLVVPNTLLAEDNASEDEGGREAIKIEPIDSTKTEADRIETAWMYNRLEFRGDDFVSLASKLEHWYNITIHFTDERVKDLSFNGSFEKETLVQALEALRLANPFEYKIENHEVFISSYR
ncbi:FecR family protein [Niabella beijingensis]|uniref:FecR family protein n=1 Tax=Niabella beijingensis TaxID=2872700 RepID=UPI001CBD5075|nr:FecR domain-containing protein [Niabella beijingensis]MBZ4189143.1 FecR family protein [Niabella beijingensis]